MTSTPMIAITASMDSRDIFWNRACALDLKRISFFFYTHRKIAEVLMPELEHTTFPESCGPGGVSDISHVHKQTNFHDEGSGDPMQDFGLSQPDEGPFTSHSGLCRNVAGLQRVVFQILVDTNGYLPRSEKELPPCSFVVPTTPTRSACG